MKRGEEDQAETDKSALMLRKCPVRPLFTVHDLKNKTKAKAYFDT